MSKQELLEELYKKYRNEFEGKEIVTGNGNVDTDIMLIGEAPGKDEVRMSLPFVGMAGKNLSEFLDILEIDREAIYITNAIKYRLSELNEKTGRLVNRPASKDEIASNRRYLLDEIKIINPKFIVTLGNVPLRSVTDNYNMAIGEFHGKLSTISLAERQYFIFPLYHPASVIYNRSLKDIYINDIYKLKDIIKEK